MKPLVLRANGFIYGYILNSRVSKMDCHTRQHAPLDIKESSIINVVDLSKKISNFFDY